MQPLIKYYNLESRSWDEVSELEINLNRHLRDQHKILPLVSEGVAKPILKALAEKAGARGLQEGNLGDLELRYDSAFSYDQGFDILFKRATEISPRIKKWFTKDTPERVRADLVIKANPFLFRNIDHYLALSNMGMRKVISINDANFNFTTKPIPISSNRAAEDFLFNLTLCGAKRNSKEMGFEMIELKYSITGKDKKFSGRISGSVERVLSLRESLSGYYAVHFEEEFLSFR
ncbi:MAG: hypothetical protein Q8R47_06230 [Nanoarchaeota archaeon]|nr:hypothetical protein [Nanoarchaeota archaeon]